MPVPQAAADPLALGKALESGLTHGQPVWLNDGETEFFSVYDEAHNKRVRGGVVLLHDIDSHPDRPQVMRPLRATLPAYGWSTLAIELPRANRNVLPTQHQAVIDARIKAALDHLSGQGVTPLFLLGHGSGAISAIHSLAGQTTPAMAGVITLNLGELKASPDEPSTLERLMSITLPVLDIVGVNAAPAIIAAARQRAVSADTGGERRSGAPASATASTPTYRQVDIPGAPHDFSGSEDILTKRVVSWLHRQTSDERIIR